MLYEKRKAPIASSGKFVERLVTQLFITIFILAISLLAGIAGYHYLESLSWMDSLLNASMILGGMGPVDALKTDGGKLFASIYAIYSGLFLIICGGLLLAPVFHRILHHFHSDDNDN